MSSNLNIEFLLGGIVSQHKTQGQIIGVREYCHIWGAKIFTDLTGKERYSIDLETFVDEEFKKNFPEKYAEFAAYVEKHKDALYPEIKANPNVKVNISSRIAAAKKAIELEKLKKLGKEKQE